MSGTELRPHDLAREAVRAEVVASAWALFSERGFAATTIEQIAEAAGMSRRTFFRYFTGKDELILERMLVTVDRVASALAARPGAEAPWAALRRAFDEVVLPQEASPERSRALQRMIRAEPALRPVLTDWRRRWRDLLAPEVAARLPRRRGSRSPDLRAITIVDAALACLETAQDVWADRPGTRLSTLVDQAMAAVGDAATRPAGN